MKSKKIISELIQVSRPYRISDGKKYKLSDIDPGDTGDFKPEDKLAAKETLESGIEMLTRLQDRLYAQDRWAVLFIFQAMDAAGKDGVIKHVMSGVNPQGCQVFSFKAPSLEELEHDYLWRCIKNLPERGRIGIFNRSYYEETLVVRVHPELLSGEKIPSRLITKNIWKDRYEDIRNFERYLTRNGVVLCKFFLHVSPKEQKQRFLDRIDNPDKNWKFSAADIEERKFWGRYMSAYEDMIRNTATEYAPWYVVPADHKWFTRVVVSGAIIETLTALDLHYPKVNGEKRKELGAAQKSLEGG